MDDQRKIDEVCLECGSDKVVERRVEQRFTYGAPGKDVSLVASFPVLSCANCEYEYFDERGEAARHAAVCKYLGVQSPEEIRQVRKATGLDRVEFCQLTGFGSASLQRWEAGTVIPNTSSDRLIFLLTFADNVQRLKARATGSQGVLPQVCGHNAEKDETTVETQLEVHTRHSTKKFSRFRNHLRVSSQSVSWNLRAR